MKRHSAVLAGIATGTAVATLAIPAPAIARPIDKGHFDEAFSSEIYDCDGTPAQDSGEVTGNFTFNQRGSSPFPYYRESVHGTRVTTNLDTGGTYTNVFTANSQDHTITDNGDGTITITVYAAGGSRFYDQFGKLVLKDPGRSGSPSTSTTTAPPATPRRHRGPRLVPGRPPLHWQQRLQRPGLLRGPVAFTSP